MTEPRKVLVTGAAGFIGYHVSNALLAKGDVVSAYADIDALEAWVGYRPSTSIEQGISKFIQWYQAYNSQREAAQ